MLNVKVSHLEIKTIGHEISVSLKQYLDLENMSDNMLEVRIRVLDYYSVSSFRQNY